MQNRRQCETGWPRSRRSRSDLKLLGKEPAPWTVRDVASIGRLQAWDLSADAEQEAVRNRVAAITPEQVRSEAAGQRACALDSPGCGVDRAFAGLGFERRCRTGGSAKPGGRDHAGAGQI